MTWDILPVVKNAGASLDYMREMRRKTFLIFTVPRDEGDDRDDGGGRGRG